jgi:hypothetical protein
VHVNGEVLAVDGTKECLSVFFSSFAAFNLNHPSHLEPLLEFLEHQLGFRKRFSKKGAKMLSLSKF